jgi:hypothetical protein
MKGILGPMLFIYSKCKIYGRRKKRDEAKKVVYRIEHSTCRAPHFRVCGLRIFKDSMTDKQMSAKVKVIRVAMGCGLCGFFRKDGKACSNNDKKYIAEGTR